VRLDPLIRCFQTLSWVGCVVLAGEGEEVWEDGVTADLEFVGCAAGCELVRGGLRVEVVPEGMEGSGREW
jgi:hypothetical protein